MVSAQRAAGMCRHTPQLRSSVQRSPPPCSSKPLSGGQREPAWRSPFLSHGSGTKSEFKVTHHYRDPWESHVRQNVTYLHDFLSANLSQTHSPACLRLAVQGALPLQCKNLYSVFLINMSAQTAQPTALCDSRDAHTSAALPFPHPHSVYLSALITEQQGRRRRVWRARCNHHGRKLRSPCT